MYKSRARRLAEANSSRGWPEQSEGTRRGKGLTRGLHQVVSSSLGVQTQVRRLKCGYNRDVLSTLFLRESNLVTH